MARFTNVRAHGNVAVPELPAGDGHLEDVDGHGWTALTGVARGWGKTYRLSASDPGRPGNWFHLPLPTVASVNDVPLFLDSYYVFFTSDQVEAGQAHTAWVRDVHLWDGSSRIDLRSDIPSMFSGNWAGPRTDPDGLTNTFFPRNADGSRKPVFTGLSVAVGVIALVGSANITFHSVGAGLADTPR